ncbi:PilZ domain-containing protein [Methylomarinum vadi]|uniref:PilZ domain-containing protein n=1 Tax=Methylomarinum vadi TaxID=438855 RepID=UPI0004DEF8D0|nr:PilZ domain-containing protein [Methylomarinum vadi]
MSNNKRRHIRLRHSAEISLQISPDDPMIVTMRDFSDSGLYLLGCDDKVELGDIVSVRTLEFDDAPTQQGKVVRIEPGQGFAIEFIS